MDISYIPCPICACVHAGQCFGQAINGWIGYTCDVCGSFGLTVEAKEKLQEFENRPNFKIKMAALSHAISNWARENSQQFVYFNEAQIADAFATVSLPTPPEQKVKLLRVIGDHVASVGSPYIQSYDTAAKVGTISAEKFRDLYEQIQSRGLITVTGTNRYPGTRDNNDVWFPEFDLTIDGWEEYQTEKKGKLAGKFGFVAFDFGKEDIAALLLAISERVKEDTGYELRHLKAYRPAGVIDNIMREQIRDAAFVIADLSHKNAGAYWEGGYAEGLGKPVIYICERKASKAEATKLHFDTNHCQTLYWDIGNEAALAADLIATIRLSLGRLM